MNAKRRSAPNQSVSLKCPTCGAPAELPANPAAVALTCEYCDQSFAIPPSIRDAQERRLRLLSGGSSGARRPIIAMVVGTTVAGMMVIALQSFSVKQQTAPQVERAPELVSEILATPTPPNSPVVSPDESETSGERRVRELMASYEQAGCRTVLLQATRIIGARDLDAKFIARGPCVRLLAAGAMGDHLDLTMKTPKGKAVDTPTAAAEIDFLYCAKQTGLHPATLRSSSERPFTIASIECPRVGD